MLLQFVVEDESIGSRVCCLGSQPLIGSVSLDKLFEPSKPGFPLQ